MKKITLCFLVLLSIYATANSQITKGNWLLGGNMDFSSNKSTSDLGENTTTITQIRGNAGYFFIDKMVAGIKPNLFFENFKTQSDINKSNRSSFGPFVRYYLLSAEQSVNLFLEGSYAFGTGKVSNQNAIHSNSFSFCGGPVFFLNSAVGVELLIGYTKQISKDNISSKNNIIQTGIGIQFHLEKE